MLITLISGSWCVCLLRAICLLQSPIPPRLSKLSSRRPVIIGPPPVHATTFCVPRVLPASLLASCQETTSDLLTPEMTCQSPSRTASTRSTATTPGYSPLSDGREGGVNSLAKPTPSSASLALRQSESKGFIGFVFESCCPPTAQPLQLKDGPADHALVLLEALNRRSQNEPSLPRFSRKRYGT